MSPYIPTLPQISREVLTVIAATILAALFFANLPALKDWVSARLPKSLPPGV
jgi:hypothetical protein